MSECSQIIYCLQEKSTHFGLEVSVVYIILILYVLNCFKYFPIHAWDKMSQKIRKEKF